MEFLHTLQHYPVLFVSVAFLLGLIVGSFLNVVILRLPPLLEYEWKKDYADFIGSDFKESKPPSIALERSHCPKCKTKLKWFHNIPLLGFLMLRGKCAFCGQGISLRYPMVELLTGLLTAFMAFQFGVTVEFVAGIILLWFLMTITWIDIDTFLIPDQLSLSLLWAGLFFSLFSFSITPAVAIIGALTGYLILWTVFQLFKLLTGKEGMGYGDFKLLAAGGAWLGYEQLIVVLLVSSLAGLLIAVIQKLMGKVENKIPFGPYLSIGILVCYVFGDEIFARLFALP